MNYHLYFHDDLDGVASGAVLLHFLKSRGDEYASYNPIDFTGDIKKNWAGHALQKPSALVDFMYHPSLDIWFDHHGSTFVYDEWRIAYRDSEMQSFDPAAKSCCGMIVRFFESTRGYIYPEQLKQLARELDVYDSATFPTIHETFAIESPSAKLGCLVDHHIDRNDRVPYRQLRKFLIDNIAAADGYDFLEKEEYVKTYERVKREQETVIRQMKERGEQIGQVIYINKIDYNLPNAHFVPFYAFPEAWYQVVVGRKDDIFKIRFSRSNWTRPQSPLDLGVIAKQKDASGGGHPGIGVIFRTTEAEAIATAQELIEYLNTNG
jgi:hypothetical protein